MHVCLFKKKKLPSKLTVANIPTLTDNYIKIDYLFITMKGKNRLYFCLQHNSVFLINASNTIQQNKKKKTYALEIVNISQLPAPLTTTMTRLAGVRTF